MLSLQQNWRTRGQKVFCWESEGGGSGTNYVSKCKNNKIKTNKK
jgi:hypothetical protein